MTLIELLVAIVIFVVGILGYAQYHTRLLQESFDHRQRSLALRKADELIDQITANRSLPALKQYVSALDNKNLCENSAKASCMVNTKPVPTASCTSQELAIYDLWNLVCHPATGLSNSLIDFSAELVCNGTCGDSSGLTLNINWISRLIDNDSRLRDVNTGKSNQSPGVSTERLTMVFYP